MLLSQSYCDLSIGRDPLWNHTLADRPELIHRFRTILNSGIVAMSFQEVVNLHRLVIRTSGIAGEIAEVGTYHGGSALIMALANAERRKRMRLFDTFSGIPEATAGVDTLHIGDVKGSSVESVRGILKDFDSLIEYHVGIFPQTTHGVPETTKFSLVNLDMDVYESTKAAYAYFYPRMSRGGAIICHDHLSKSCPGVKRAVDEFFSDKPETLVELWHTQIVMIKM